MSVYFLDLLLSFLYLQPILKQVLVTLTDPDKNLAPMGDVKCPKNRRWDENSSLVHQTAGRWWLLP